MVTRTIANRAQRFARDTSLATWFRDIQATRLSLTLLTGTALNACYDTNV